MNFSVVTTQFWSLVLQGLALGLIYSLVALGYTMVYGVLRLINFANSEVFMLGTFAVLWVEIELLDHPVTAKPLAGFELVYTLVIALVGSMIACAVLAVLVELVAYRRLRARGAAPLSSLISAIGVSIFLMETMRMLQSHAHRQPHVYLISGALARSRALTSASTPCWRLFPQLLSS